MAGGRPRRPRAGGCTGDTAPEPTPTASSAPAAQPEPTTEPSPAASVDVAASSREVLDAASAAQAARDEVLASQTVEVPLGLTASETGEVTVDVRRVERREASTLVTIGLSAAAPGTQLAPDVFSDRRDLEQLHQVALEDPAGGERYLPLSWRRWISTPDNLVLDGPANTCVCPSRAQLLLGPEPGSWTCSTALCRTTSPRCP